MKIKVTYISILLVTLSLLAIGSVTSAQDLNKRSRSTRSKAVTQIPSISLYAIKWETVVNHGQLVPSGKATFASYDAPTVNSSGVVAFRGIVAGDTPMPGIFYRQFPKGDLVRLADLNTIAAGPNNQFALYKAFPSVPRISAGQMNIAFAAEHTPVFGDPTSGEDVPAIGSAGIYAELNGNGVFAGASQLGGLPDFDYFSVPNTKMQPFESFPDSASITDNGSLVFKGKFTRFGVEQYGIYIRQMVSEPKIGESPVQKIVDLDTNIPYLGSPHYKAIKFGWFSAPTSIDGYTVFAGYDNAKSPNFGGVYFVASREGMTPEPIVTIGTPIADLKLPELRAIGSEISFDGQYVAFQASFGTRLNKLRLNCPTTGDDKLIAYCNGIDPNSELDPDGNIWFQWVSVPADQAIIVYDLKSQRAYLAAGTDSFADFTYWQYAGKDPFAGSQNKDDMPKWQPMSYVSVSGGMVAFKARKMNAPGGRDLQLPVDGIYVTDFINSSTFELVTTGMDGLVLDPGTPQSAKGYNLPITELGLDRDGFRGNKLAINAMMTDLWTSWGGVYLADVNGVSVRK